MNRLNLLRLLSFLLPFILVIGLLWFLPMVGGEKVTRFTMEPKRAYTVDERNPFDTTFNWKFDVDVKTQPTYILPRLPYEYVTRGGSDPGDTSLFMDLRIFINGREADRVSSGWQMDLPGTSTKGRSEGYPLYIEDVDQSLVQQGANEVEVRVRLYRAEGHEGTGIYSFIFGPVNVEVHNADLDGDGIRDDRQPFSQLHTGLLAVPLGLLAGGVGLVIFVRRHPR